MALTLRQLGYFLALAEERHFSKAAERVHVTQPALSMQIREMEDALGTQLFERSPRDIRLTPAGREVETRARRILGQVSELEAVARQQGLVGRINLGVIPTVAPYLLPEVLPLLRASDITRDLRLREATTDLLLAGLDRGQLDAVVIAEPPSSAGLVLAPLFTDRFLLAGRRSVLEGLADGAEALRPVTLDPDQLLLLDEGHCLADQALEVCGMTRRQSRLDLGASSLTTLCGLVGQGLGMTFLPEIALRQEQAATPGMAVTRFAAPEPSRQIVLGRRATSSASDWFDELVSLFSQAGQGLTAQARLIA
ncbi:LysR family transcriptional regulator [Cereibacter changlensis JA139]|uniref:LysR family transcriptional regulator n=2 Tax=Cereibacter changlensis TaxID=402884 RepID=A0A2T4JX26_9RHOB|nr:LysR substrate-binding domain-containing protein [Cereibacter changlensis]PTE22303.1 LysR family transcriptional regulator [Cereibacter changlensis JA139]PZX57356.1 LysR family hydrogen peroxide-inducible transcriptional activator [Cereibacter changlensis]